MEKNRILTELPKKGNLVNWKETVGMVLELFYNGKIYKVKIIKYKSSRIWTDYNGYVYKKGIPCSNFKNGIFGGVLGISHESKNKFEYSQEHSCWFGWTQKGEKFAFDGDEDTLKFIMSNTWYSAKNSVYCSIHSKTLTEAVYGRKARKNKVLSHKSNDLKLLSDKHDSRRCNIYESCQTTDNKIYDMDKNYRYEIIDKEDYYLVTLKKGNFKLSKNEHSLNVLNNWICDIVKINGKQYVSCRDCNGNNNKLLHRILFDLIGDKYKSWHIDHLNGDGLDNRMENLVITDHYGNMCNRPSVGYVKTKNNTYYVQFMKDYPDDSLFGEFSRTPTFKTEEEAINEVVRRREYIMKNRLTFNSKKDLDAYIQLYKL